MRLKSPQKVETMSNTLYYGDNLQVLRDHVAGESVELARLGSPFNSKAPYNILCKAY